MKHTQPMNLTKPIWSWRKKFGRLRMGWISPYNWRLGGAYWWSWFFMFIHYPAKRVIQITILGLNVAYCYRKDFKL